MIDDKFGAFIKQFCRYQFTQSTVLEIRRKLMRKLKRPEWTTKKKKTLMNSGEGFQHLEGSDSNKTLYTQFALLLTGQHIIVTFGLYFVFLRASSTTNKY